MYSRTKEAGVDLLYIFIYKTFKLNIENAATFQNQKISKVISGTGLGFVCF